MRLLHQSSDRLPARYIVHIRHIVPIPGLVAKLPVEPLRAIVAGVVLVPVAVVFFVHLFGVLLGGVLGTLTVDEVLALGLSELVDLSGSEASKELLGEGVLDGLT